MPDSPLVKAALICENVIERKDGVLSLINIVDKRIVSVTGDSAPADMPEHLWDFYLVLMLTSGSYAGKANIAVSVQGPDGMRKPVLAQEQRFEGEERGINLIFGLQFAFQKEGLYWFEAYADTQFLTKVPLRVLYQRMRPGFLPAP